MTERLLTPGEVAHELAVSPGTLRNWRREQRGPSWIQLGSGRIRYTRAAIDAWLTHHNTTDTAS